MHNHHMCQHQWEEIRPYMGRRQQQCTHCKTFQYMSEPGVRPMQGTGGSADAAHMGGYEGSGGSVVTAVGPQAIKTDDKITVRMDVDLRKWKPLTYVVQPTPATEADKNIATKDLPDDVFNVLMSQFILDMYAAAGKMSVWTIKHTTTPR